MRVKLDKNLDKDAFRSSTKIGLNKDAFNNSKTAMGYPPKLAWIKMRLDKD